MNNLKGFIEERVGRILRIIETTTQKIIRKELKKLKKDMINGIIKKKSVQNPRTKACMVCS